MRKEVYVLMNKIIRVSIVIFLSIASTVVILFATLLAIGWSRLDIEDGVLYGYIGLSRHVTIPNNVTIIRAGAFHSRGSFSTNRIIRTVYIPYGVTTIERFAFINSTSLQEVNIPNSVTSLGAGAFQYCTSLVSVRLSENITVIRGGTFRHNSSLEHIYIPQGVIEIEHAAFAFNTSLRSINLPRNLQYIGSDAFWLNTSLTEMQVDELNPHFSSIDGVLFETANVEEDSSFDENMLILRMYPIAREDTFYAIPDNVVDIYYMAFWAARYLKELYIPGSIIEIGQRTFIWTYNLTYVTISDGVMRIGNNAFGDNPALTRIYIPESVIYIADNAFENSDNVTIVGARGSFAEEYANRSNIPFVTG